MHILCQPSQQSGLASAAAAPAFTCSLLPASYGAAPGITVPCGLFAYSRFSTFFLSFYHGVFCKDSMRGDRNLSKSCFLVDIDDEDSYSQEVHI